MNFFYWGGLNLILKGVGSITDILGFFSGLGFLYHLQKYTLGCLLSIQITWNLTNFSTKPLSVSSFYGDFVFFVGNGILYFEP